MITRYLCTACGAIALTKLGRPWAKGDVMRSRGVMMASGRFARSGQSGGNCRGCGVRLGWGLSKLKPEIVDAHLTKEVK